MLLHGLPDRIASDPKTWPVWWYGQNRTNVLGIMMIYLYATGQYAACDACLLIMGAWYLVGDIIVFWRIGKLETGLNRIGPAFAMLTCGMGGLTQWL